MSTDWTPKRCSHITRRLVHDPDIRVLISGLYALWLWETYADLKILRVPNHEFRIFVDTLCKTDGPDDGKLVSRQCFSEFPFCHLVLATPESHKSEWAPCNPPHQASPDPNYGWGAGVNVYQREPFDRDTLEREAFQEAYDGSIVGSDDPHDFRWLIDMTSRDFYRRNAPLHIPERLICPHIYIGNGQFYTAVRSPQAFDRVTIRRAGMQYPSYPTGERYYLGRIALVLGINIIAGYGGALEIWSGPPTTTMGYAGSPSAYKAVSPGYKLGDLIRFDTAKYRYKVAFANLHPPFSQATDDTSDFPELGDALVRDPYGLDQQDVYDLQPTSRANTQPAPCTGVGG